MTPDTRCTRCDEPASRWVGGDAEAVARFRGLFLLRVQSEAVSRELAGDLCPACLVWVGANVADGWSTPAARAGRPRGGVARATVLPADG